MSVGDVKGARRRFKVRLQKGLFPRPKSRDVHDSIARARTVAERMAKAAKKKK